VGHYPFSHAMEDAIKNYSGIQFLEPFERDAVETLEHESVSEEVVKYDNEISALISSSGHSTSKICSIFSGNRPDGELPIFCNVVNSEMDADRIDYMLRAAHQSGLPYGSIDLQYLLSQLRLDSRNRICLTSRAVRTAEHFVLCRYFDYQQISYHKAVASLEWALKQVLAELLGNGMISGTAEWVRGAIRSGEWHSFDDPQIISRINGLRSTDGTSSSIITLCDVVLRRNPPKLLAEIESIQPYSEGENEAAADGQRVLEDYRRYLGLPPKSWSSRYGSRTTG
jgi:HD superfamily phosphohydrolase